MATYDFNLIAEPECGIAIDSSCSDYTGAEDAFTKEHSIVLNIVHKKWDPDNKQDCQITVDENVPECAFLTHKDPTEVTHHKFTKGDGIYIIDHFVIPYSAHSGSISVKCVINGDKPKLVTGPNETEIAESQYLEVLLNASDIPHTQATTLCTCGLHECYYHLAMELLQQPGICDTQERRDLIYKRDLVWMGINVIDYLLDQGNIYEANAILWKLEGCNGVCSKNLGHKPFKSCGCNK